MVLGASLAALLLLAVVVVLLARPSQMGEKVLEVVDAEGSVAVTSLALENMDANRGTIKLRLTVHSGSRPVPPQGASLLTSVAGLGPVTLPLSELTAESSTEMLLDMGDLSDYPFDEYEVNLAMALVEGTGITDDTDPTSLHYLPVSLVATSMLSGFDASAEAKPSAEISEVRFTMQRPVPTVVWAVAMMVIYWLLAIGAAGVVIATVLRLRPFETRHLAWLTALLFAFAAFRNTAPGSPPIGVFLDFGAFFWAVAIVVLAELAFVAYYLSGSRRPSSS